MELVSSNTQNAMLLLQSVLKLAHGITLTGESLQRRPSWVIHLDKQSVSLTVQVPLLFHQYISPHKQVTNEENAGKITSFRFCY